MSTIEMSEDKMVCTVEGNGEKSVVTISASVITLETSKVNLEGETLC